MDPIVAAATHLDADALEDALVALIAAWRRHRAPELAALIDTLSAHAARSVPPLDADAGPEAAYLERARLGRQVDVPLLIGQLTERPKGAIPQRVRALLDRGPDPRVGKVLLASIVSPPLTASANFWMWTAIFAALPDFVDASARPALEARAATHDGSSQFWPKLTGWIRAALPKLPEPAALPEAWRPGVEALTARAESLLAGRAPPIAPPGSAPSPAPTPVGSLSSARDALLARDLDGALDALVSFWGGCRAPEVASAIERLGRVVDARRPAIEVGKDLQRLWLAAADRALPSDVGRLLEVYRQGTWVQIEPRMEAMRRWAPDPRVFQALLVLIGDYTLGARKNMWAPIYDLLVHNADPRAAETILVRHESLSGARIAHRRIAEGRESDRVIPAFREAIAPSTALPSADREALAEIGSEIDRLASAASAVDALEEQLVEAIVASPAEDGPRLVYADWLRERNDPRSDFIVLDLALARGEKVKGKRNALLKQHRDALLGPLAGLVDGGEDMFERGLLTRARVTVHRGTALSEPALRDLRWRTVRALESWDDLAPLLRHAPLSSLERMGRIELPALLAIAERAAPLPIVSIDLGADPDTPHDQWMQLAAVAPKLPALRELGILIWSRDADRVTPPLAFFDSPLVRQLDRLYSGGKRIGGISRPDEWIAALSQTSCPVPRVDLLGGSMQTRMVRDGARYRLALTVGFAVGPEPERRVEMLRALSPEQVVLTSLDFVDGDEARPAVEAAVAHLPRA